MARPPKNKAPVGARAKNEAKVGAGAAGAGGGTLLVLLARNLPDDNPWKSWLVLLAPAVTVFLSGSWLWIQAAIAERAREKEKRQLFEMAKETIRKSMDDPHGSPEHKESLRKTLEDLQLIEVSGMYARIKLLEDSETVA